MDILSELAKKYRTDKGIEHHCYTPVYYEYFKGIRNEQFKFLEIGLGEITSANREGESIKMWEEFFPNALIYGIDIQDKSFLSGGRVNIFQGDQTDESFLINVLKKIGEPRLKVIIDDASHINPYTIKTFEILFQALVPGGIYCIEDTVTSYWSGWQGEPNVINPSRETVMSYFLNLCHNVNMLKRENFHNEVSFDPKFTWYRDIKSIHFYNSQIFILKR